MNSSQQSRRQGRLDRIDPAAVAGFGSTLFLVLLPVNDVRLWLDLSEYRRWAWTDVLVAGLVLALAMFMRRSRAGEPVLLLLVALGAAVVVAGEAYDLWFALARPMEDDFLAAITNVLGFWGLAACSAVGLLGSLFPSSDHASAR